MRRKPKTLREKFYSDYNKTRIHTMDGSVLWGVNWGLKLAKKAVKSPAQPWASVYIQALIEELNEKA